MTLQNNVWNDPSPTNKQSTNKMSQTNELFMSHYSCYLAIIKKKSLNLDKICAK